MSDNRSALALVILSVTLLAAGDAVVRLLGESLHVGQVIAYRGVLVMVIIAIGLVVAGFRLRRDHLFNKWALVRGLAETVTTYTFFISIQFVPIAISTTIVFIFPVLLTLVSIPIYGEKVGPFRWLAVAMGFLGVMIISNPMGEDFNWIMILPVITAVALVGRDLITRKVPKDISAAEVTLTTAFVTTIFGFASFPLGWGALQPAHYGMLPLAAGLVALSFITYVMAIRKGELSIIAPAQYLIILWATFWGALIWQEYPSQHAIFGGMLIIAAGGLIIWRESVHSKKQASA